MVRDGATVPGWDARTEPNCSSLLPASRSTQRCSILRRWKRGSLRTTCVAAFSGSMRGQVAGSGWSSTYLDGSQGKSSAHSDITEVTFVELLAGQRVVQQVMFDSDEPAFGGTMTRRGRCSRCRTGRSWRSGPMTSRQVSRRVITRSGWRRL